MAPYDDPFEPEHSDEQIERHIQQAPQEMPSLHDEEIIIQKLRNYYYKQKKEESLDKVWKNILWKYDTMQPASSGELFVLPESDKKERIDPNTMQQEISGIPQIKKRKRAWGAIAVAAILLFVVGSMAVLMTKGNESTKTGGGRQPSQPAVTCVMPGSSSKPTTTSVMCTPTKIPTSQQPTKVLATPTSTCVMPGASFKPVNAVAMCTPTATSTGQKP